jgi:hypothetical protein
MRPEVPGIPSWPNWRYDLDLGTLTFSKDGIPRVRLSSSGWYHLKEIRNMAMALG